MNAIKVSPKKTAPSGNTNSSAEATLNPPKSMIPPATNPATEAEARVLVNFVISSKMHKDGAPHSPVFVRSTTFFAGGK